MPERDARVQGLQCLGAARREVLRRLHIADNGARLAEDRRNKAEGENMNPNKTEMCFYVPGEGHIIDLATPDGKSTVYAETPAELCKRYPGAVLMPFEDACQAINTIEHARYGVPPVEITEERFLEMLECLPPCRWVRLAESEAFYMSEFETGLWTGHYCRIGERYFAATRQARGSSTFDFITECGNILTAGAALTST